MIQHIARQHKYVAPGKIRIYSHNLGNFIVLSVVLIGQAQLCHPRTGVGI